MAMDNVRKMIESAYDTQIKKAEYTGATRRGEYASTANRRSAISGLKGSLANASIRNAQAKADEITGNQIGDINSARNRDLIGVAMKEDEIARAEAEGEKNRKMQREMAGWNALSGILGGIGGTAGLLGLGANALKSKGYTYSDSVNKASDLMPYGSGSVPNVSGLYEDDDTYLNSGVVTPPKK